MTDDRLYVLLDLIPYTDVAIVKRLLLQDVIWFVLFQTFETMAEPVLMPIENGDRVASRAPTHPYITAYQHVPGFIVALLLPVQLQCPEEGLHLHCALLQEVCGGIRGKLMEV